MIIKIFYLCIPYFDLVNIEKAFKFEACAEWVAIVNYKKEDLQIRIVYNIL